jgi:hypothetical protein
MNVGSQIISEKSPKGWPCGSPPPTLGVLPPQGKKMLTRFIEANSAGEVVDQKREENNHAGRGR